MDRDSDDVPLTLKFSSVEDFFNCPVCMSEFQETRTTPCGHRFCGRCIEQCLSRKNRCPCCNFKIKNPNELIKDCQFDALLAIVAEEKNKSEENYFNQLIHSAISANSNNTANSECLTDLQEVLKKHLKTASLDHERYLKELETICKTEEEKITAEFVSKRIRVENLNLSAAAKKKELENIQKEETVQKNMLQSKLTLLRKNVCDALDRYLSDRIPQVSILPVTVTISLLNKNVSVPNIIIQPTDSLTEIMEIIKRQMNAIGNKVRAFQENVQFFAFKPLHNYSIHEMLEIVEDQTASSDSPPFTPLLPGHQLVLEGNLLMGSHIAVYGNIDFETDLPKNCFSQTFVKNSSQSEDYFKCETCGFTWICRCCSEICHEGHKLTPYILNHIPSWACCYCPKKSHCSFRQLNPG